MCVCVFVQHTRKEATELKLHAGMKARGNFNIKHELSEKLFNSSTASGLFRQTVCEMTDATHQNRKPHKQT